MTEINKLLIQKQNIVNNVMHKNKLDVEGFIESGDKINV